MHATLIALPDVPTEMMYIAGASSAVCVNDYLCLCERGRLARDDEAIFAATELCYEGHRSYDCRFPDRSPGVLSGEPAVMSRITYDGLLMPEGDETL